jgi:hypothetical protein
MGNVWHVGESGVWGTCNLERFHAVTDFELRVSVNVVFSLLLSDDDRLLDTLCDKAE